MEVSTQQEEKARTLPLKMEWENEGNAKAMYIGFTSC